MPQVKASLSVPSKALSGSPNAGLSDRPPLKQPRESQSLGGDAASNLLVSSGDFPPSHLEITAWYQISDLCWSTLESVSNLFQIPTSGKDICVLLCKQEAIVQEAGWFNESALGHSSI